MGILEFVTYLIIGCLFFISIALYILSRSTSFVAEGDGEGRDKRVEKTEYDKAA